MEPFDTAGHQWDCVVVLVDAKKGEDPDPENPLLQAMEPSFRQMRHSCKYTYISPDDLDDRALQMMALGKDDVRVMGTFLVALIHVEAEGKTLHKYYLRGQDKLLNKTAVSKF